MSVPCLLRVGRFGRAMPTGVLACVSAGFLVLMVPAWFLLAEPPVITSFHGNGSLSWSSSPGTNGFSIEWAPAVTGPWYTNWNNLDAVVTWGSSPHTVSVPMFFRVKQAFTPIMLRGVWMMLCPPEGNMYMVSYDDGVIAESAMFVPWGPSGYLTMSEEGHLSITFMTHDEIILVNAHVLGASDIAMEAPYSPGVIRRVEDVSKCEGHWSGTLNWRNLTGAPISSNLAFSVDWRGLVTNVTSLVAHNNIGRMFATQQGAASAFIYQGYTGIANDPFNKFRLSGAVTNNNFTGTFKLDDGQTTGSVSLVRN